MASVSLVTPTGDRQLSFDLCELWMSRQTFDGEIEWIVVDDGAVPTMATMAQEVIRLDPQDGNTLPRNLDAGLRAATGDIVLVIEDDDWYSPVYVASMVEAFERTDGKRLIGERPSRYYNVSNRTHRTFPNEARTSLCQTGIPDSLIRSTFSLIEGDCFVDIRLWRGLPGELHDGRGCVGIKGLPTARPGCGAGHRMIGTPDPDLTVLREWIGADDAWRYAQWAT